MSITNRLQSSLKALVIDFFFFPIVVAKKNKKEDCFFHQFPSRELDKPLTGTKTSGKNQMKNQSPN